MVILVLMSVIGENLCRLRKARGWTQKELAARTLGRVKQADISRIEKGDRDPGASRLKILADSLGVSIGEFWKGAEPTEARADPSFAEFLASPVAQGLTAKERELLSKAVFPLGERPTQAAWFIALQLVREQLRGE